MKTLLKWFVPLMVLSLLLAACQPAATPTPEKVIETVTVEKEKEVVKTVEVEKPAERAVVRLSGWAASPEETALLQSILLDFTVENPDIVVKYEPITGDYWQQLKTSIASGVEPDVFYMDIFQFPAFVRDEVLLPIDDLMAKEGVKRDDFIPSLIDAFSDIARKWGDVYLKIIGDGELRREVLTRSYLRYSQRLQHAGSFLQQRSLRSGGHCRTDG